MKLLVSTGLYPPDIGGPASYTVFLEKHASEHGLELVVVPFTHFRKYPPGIRHLFYFAHLVWKSRGCTVLYALDTVSVGVPALLTSLLTRKPLLLRVPGDYAWEQGQQRFGVTEGLDTYRMHGTLPLPVRFLFWLQYQVARHAHHIIVPSEYMRSVVSGWKIESSKITRIYSELKPLTVPKHARDEHVPFIVSTAARLVPWKGMSALIDAVVRLHTEGLPIVLNIVGDGICRKDLEKQVVEQRATGFVTFLGALPRAELGPVLSQSNVFVLNTSYEGLSHQLLEVMDLGVPVVTTPVGGNVELIQDGESGLFVPYNDSNSITEAIRRLYEHKELGVLLARTAKESVSKFSEEVVVREFVALLHTVWKSSR